LESKLFDSALFSQGATPKSQNQAGQKSEESQAKVLKAQ